MNNKNLITVKELSNITNISTQKIYRLIEQKEYEKYKIKKNGNVYINKNIISLLLDKEETKEIKEETQENPKETTTETEKEYINFLKKEIEELKEQLNNKENKINELTQQITQIAVNAQTLADKALTTTSQSQFLQANEQIKKKSFFRRLLERK